METSHTCAAPGCSRSLAGKRSHSRYCTEACKKRAKRQRERIAHPHPHRNSRQYKQMRDMWPEYVGYHWLSPESESIDEDCAGNAGSWDRYLRRTGQEYATAY